MGVGPIRDPCVGEKTGRCEDTSLDFLVLDKREMGPGGIGDDNAMEGVVGGPRWGWVGKCGMELGGIMM